MNLSFSPCDCCKMQLSSLLRSTPQAVAIMSGGKAYPGLSGTVYFYQTPRGVIVLAGIQGLPEGGRPCRERIFGFHIHGGSSCEDSAEDPFPETLSHYDPSGCPHPCHAGDLPPLFGNDGEALSLFLTNRFSVKEVTGKTLVIHGGPDDFTSQPSGNSGEKIACGVIRRIC